MARGGKWAALISGFLSRRSKPPDRLRSARPGGRV